MPLHQSTCVVANVSGPFGVGLRPNLAAIAFGALSAKGRLEGARPLQNSPSQTASLFVRGIGDTSRAYGFEFASWGIPQ